MIFSYRLLALAIFILSSNMSKAEPRRAPSILHRVVMSCDGSQLSAEQKVDLKSTGYSNFKCTNRFQEQCLNDGSWDNFYMEWCEYEAPTCAVTTLHRQVRSCQGGNIGTAQTIDIQATGYSNYTCGNRYQEQCINDGTADQYYVEWCDYSCDSGTSPSTSCQPKDLYRTVSSCRGEVVQAETKIGLSSGYSNYTCNNRFVEQCAQDGSFDQYYTERCDYSCPSNPK